MLLLEMIDEDVVDKIRLEHERWSPKEITFGDMDSGRAYSALYEALSKLLEECDRAIATAEADGPYGYRD